MKASTEKRTASSERKAPAKKVGSALSGSGKTSSGSAMKRTGKSSVKEVAKSSGKMGHATSSKTKKSAARGGSNGGYTPVSTNRTVKSHPLPPTLGVERIREAVEAVVFKRKAGGN